MSASDPEDDALSYAITGGDPDALFEFDIDGNLKVAAGKSLDYETTQQHVLQVEVTDTGGLSDTAEVIVNVGDVNEVPEIVTAAFSVDENQTYVGTIEASDPENDTLTFALTGDGADHLDPARSSRLTALVNLHVHGRQFVDGKPVFGLRTPPSLGLQLTYPWGDLGVVQELMRFLLLRGQRVILRVASRLISLPGVANFYVCAGKGFLLTCKRCHWYLPQC